MAFTSSLEMKNSVAHITLGGELDAASAPEFRADVERAAAEQCSRVVLNMDQLTFMASAGLRVLVFAKQKMGSHVDIYMVGMQDDVSETITMTGVDRSVIIVDAYDPTTMEVN